MFLTVPLRSDILRLSRQNRGVLLLSPPNAQSKIVGKAPSMRIRPICLDSGGIKTHGGRFVMPRTVVKHGMYGTREYKSWESMLERCRNPNHKFYSRYGGRGISVCERWYEFEEFYKDMGPRPRGRSLHRINDDGDYEPENCCWATQTVQNRNRGDYNHVIVYNGKAKCLSEWSEITGINRVTIRNRIRRGWSIEEALTRPVDLGNRWIRKGERHAT